ncbi:unnamed protein product [Medioppia subpectinata]|uniref:Uncharacterized protein n=1 Tax=Medioppia subpectinata TaxID=1979941 RepID=A0A7R9PX64_9ACAR|nr:unnamed protein product [Medioppia subpectinata]CAG2104470.1 unnamed protein product [Medioppia subpectinata]
MIFIILNVKKMNKMIVLLLVSALVVLTTMDAVTASPINGNIDIHRAKRYVKCGQISCSTGLNIMLN